MVEYAEEKVERKCKLRYSYEVLKMCKSGSHVYKTKWLTDRVTVKMKCTFFKYLGAASGNEWRM